MTTCAEGVENEETLAILRSMGCDEAQGYLFSPPVAADEMTQILEAAKNESAELGAGNGSKEMPPSGSPISRGRSRLRAHPPCDEAPGDGQLELDKAVGNTG
jgi:hypothetical protein